MLHGGLAVVIDQLASHTGRYPTAGWAHVHGVDPADLDQILEPWLGGVEGPRYTPMYVRIEGKKVLIVVVEAPKSGDPICTLRKEFADGRDGDVFIRTSGRTDRANSADMKALVERAAAVSVSSAKAHRDLQSSLMAGAVSEGGTHGEALRTSQEGDVRI